MSRRRLVRLVPALPLALLLWVGSAAAHGGDLPWIWIEHEAVEPGKPFTALVVDFTPLSEVELEVSSGDRRATLGTVPTESDGHGEGRLTVPADFPLGYAELTGRDAGGAEAVTLVQVGESDGAVGPPAPGGPARGRPGQAGWWLDPSVLTLLALVGGAGVLLVVHILRRGRRRSA